MSASNTNKESRSFIRSIPESMRNYPHGLYDKNPIFKINKGKIGKSFSLLAEQTIEKVSQGLRVLVVDGYHGVNWNLFRSRIDKELRERGLKVKWMNMEDCFAIPEVINKKISPFLGGKDPLFGTHYPFGIEVFFDASKVGNFRIAAAIARGDKAGDLSIFYGCGASLIELWDELWYIDYPKDLLQIDVRKGKTTNLGCKTFSSFEDFYKRSYFVEWPAQNRLKRDLLPQIDKLVDMQNPETPTYISGEDFRETLHELSESPFRVKAWFFPGPWGGKYMQHHIGLDPDQPNFAWSYEIITPENGILIGDGEDKLEFSFDFLMYQENKRVLGENAARQFKYEWPIRLDYLDTIDGGNLSIQCHPRPNFIKKEFGETFTQDEAYYIVNSKPASTVNIGLTESCDQDEFREAVELSLKTGKEIDIYRFVNQELSKPHDLFLIPNGTVHGSGKGNLVLEISATPYIFTFKIYDWARKDLEGKLRPLNIERAWENIRFERKKSYVKKHLIAKPKLLKQGRGWKEYVLYDSKYTFYNIHRVDFDNEYEMVTEKKAFAINLVEGQECEITSKNGRKIEMHYHESMIVPAAVEKSKVVNKGNIPCKLVMVYVRPEVGISEPLNNPND